ncbi:hypothetical protein SDC9_169288 [bioreactor metagenome]|uniref:Uncharacterized protein n=1 Tax=bioreactor metagenome TaxID=1076179 RepID=A0A645G6X4_9ZZZZ
MEDMKVMTLSLYVINVMTNGWIVGIMQGLK